MIDCMHYEVTHRLSKLHKRIENIGRAKFADKRKKDFGFPEGFEHGTFYARCLGVIFILFRALKPDSAPPCGSAWKPAAAGRTQRRTNESHARRGRTAGRVVATS
jgi:hypothetical protein